MKFQVLHTHADQEPMEGCVHEGRTLAIALDEAMEHAGMVERTSTKTAALSALAEGFFIAKDRVAFTARSVS